ncbi:MAG: ROK family protein [Bdellovibrionota bacterium]
MKKSSTALKYSIGLDLGGTKLATALVDSRGNILEYNKFPLEINKTKSPQEAKKKVISFMQSACEDYKRRYPTQTSAKNFMGIGLASAGPLNIKTGELIDPSNFKDWKRFKIVQELTSALKKINWQPKIYFQNDAIASAFAEKWIGAAKNCKSFVVVTVGTGIGTGVIFNGLPCQTEGMGSEWGHLLVDVKGMQQHKSMITEHTVEGIASGTALLKRAKALGFKGSSVEELVVENEQTTQYKILFDDMAWALAALCYSLSMGFHFDKILFSGGLIKIKHLYWEQTKKIYSDMIRQRNPAFLAPIAVAKAGNKAGVVGAASLPYLLRN